MKSRADAQLLRRLHDRGEDVHRAGALDAFAMKTHVSPTRTYTRTQLVLLRNILVAREPMYGLGQWAARFAPDLLDLWPHEVELLNDDRAGRALHQMFDALASELTVTVVRRVIDEFHINLDELHNDSTSVSFYGAYQQAEEERQVRGQRTLPITFGHSKDHRPDLKQLLFILTVSEDGGVITRSRPTASASRST